MIINNVKRAFTANSGSCQSVSAGALTSSACVVNDGYSNDRADWQRQAQQINAMQNQRQQMAAEFAASRAEANAATADGPKPAKQEFQRYLAQSMMQLNQRHTAALQQASQGLSLSN